MRGYLFNILIIFVVFSACSSKPVIAPVSSYPQPPSTKVKYHIVASGETLYSISWRYGLDHKMVAIANKIGDGATIYPGQRISLTPPSQQQIAAASKRGSWVPSWVPDVKNNSKVAAKKPSNRSINRSVEKKELIQNTSTNASLKWRWPAQGKIVKGFNANQGLNKGIDIRGKLREPVLAAAPGTVVYAGDGLRGYGKLVILKHSNKFLSAYAHNRRIHVKEGDQVDVSEKIAEMGDTGTDSVKLHFEIRFDGKPVDPLIYLPPK